MVHLNAGIDTSFWKKWENCNFWELHYSRAILKTQQKSMRDLPMSRIEAELKRTKIRENWVINCGDSKRWHSYLGGEGFRSTTWREWRPYPHFYLRCISVLPRFGRHYVMYVKMLCSWMILALRSFLSRFKFFKPCVVDPHLRLWYVNPLRAVASYKMLTLINEMQTLLP